MMILGPNSRTSISFGSHVTLKALMAHTAHTFPAPNTSREMRQDRSLVSGTRNKANRGNRKVTYHAYRAFFALF
jgi:hypothetical protein